KREAIVAEVLPANDKSKNPDPPRKQEAAVGQDGQLNLALADDVTQLSEIVVVTGFGQENARYMTGAVRLRDEVTANLYAYGALENALQGRVAGLQVQQQNANPSQSPVIQIRGISSFASGNGEPLYVIDGLPVSTTVDRNFSNSILVNPEDISSIEILTGAEASAFFGSNAANGVIMISTKSRTSHQQFKQKQRVPRYNTLLVSPRTFSPTREFFTEPRFNSGTGERRDIKSTVYWNPTVITNAKGEATITFNNNDAVTAFRVTAEGIGQDGLIGRSENVYSTQLPFSLDAKIPGYLGFEDTLRFPLVIKNNTPNRLNADVSLELPAAISTPDETTFFVSLDPNASKTVFITAIPTGIEGDFGIGINAKADGHHDAIRETIAIHPIGFPMRLSMSGKETEKSFAVDLREVEKGSVKGQMTAFTDVLSDLSTGVESILREPHGCFEQTSSSTFPNILALQFLRESNQVRPETERKALKYIRQGYERLISFEVRGGGFEWFGSPPAHEGLTAYGLIEFHEMKKIYDGVDEKMMARTRDWLLSRRKGDGTFDQRTNGLDDFSRPSGDVTNAYITYALSEVGYTKIDVEYQHSYNEALKSRDMYRLALLANTAFNLDKMADYSSLIDLFRKEVEEKGIGLLHADHSVVWSQGVSLANETLALWVIALLKSGDKNLDLANQGVQTIVSKRSFGMFGSTQATILCLKALTEYAKRVQANRASGQILVALNDEVTDTHSYTPDTREPVLLDNFTKNFREGRNTMSVLFSNTTKALPYSVNISWNTKTPVSNHECNVALDTKLASRRIRVNESVRMKVVLQNRSSRGQPMTMAVIGIPAGLSPQPWQLKELQEKKVFDFYEIIGDRLALYYRQLKPRETKEINLDLKADVAGSFTGVASSAYLYYTDEYKWWVEGSRIEILP
ncbi:MAG TPA: TonB-dependent receptor plug domain-containing protein, partial [Chryseosolibacter sp.]|nr:TonB-dependent receptor plug domain-containing protein [Chryseosolibacter sp.]